mmetsp:Transcript_27803/g.50516  ORF Transcript_27803/g.50516 Transcript_27803/m.50516 type:complete len:577 (-) Transcript_27803:1959-3689(-)
MSEPKANVPPTNALVTPLLTDLYQITMAYAYWKTNRHMDHAVFELFFRKNPFGGEYTVFCGIDEVLKYLNCFLFTKADLDYLRNTPTLAHCDPAFFDDYLAHLDCSQLQVHSMKQGCLAFPRVPLIIVSGPLGIAQLLETTLLTLINFPSLIATNATRMVVAARNQHSSQIRNRKNETNNNDKSPTTLLPKQCSKVPQCIEFGLRRAQGPDGGFSASKYAWVGGFDGTSNVQAGNILGIPISGTHAHSFVQAHSSLEEIKDLVVTDLKTGQDVKLLPRILEYRKQNEEWESTNDGELAAFIAYAVAFPNSCLCLVDTYETLQSGLKNFIMVALVLDDLGYMPKGIRLDSGDLAYLSMECAREFAAVATKFDRPFFHDLGIVASNDINEYVLHSLNKEGHAITVFGIGTHLVTCQAQPALGCVYKLVEINGTPRMKLSQDLEKVLIPGQKVAYRVYGESGCPLLDLMVGKDQDVDNLPKVGERYLCRHPFIGQKRVAVVPAKLELLHNLVFDKKNGVVIEEPGLNAAKKFVAEQIQELRPDILRNINPGQYKVSISDTLFEYLHTLWLSETPVVELH